MCVAVTVVPDELGAWLVQQRRWMNSANIMDLRQLFINLSWVNSKARVFLYIIQLLRWMEFNAGLGICFGERHALLCCLFFPCVCVCLCNNTQCPAAQPYSLLAQLLQHWIPSYTCGHRNDSVLMHMS